MRKAANEANVDISHVAEVEKRRSMAVRLLDSLGTNTSLATFAMAGYVPGAETPVESDLRGLIRTTIEELAQRGEAVIVAHAASMALGDRSDVLKVMLTASREARARHVLAEQRDLDEKAAAKQVDKGDANRADYLKRFYGITHESPADYDLVLNTDRLGPDGAVRLIVQAVGVPQPAA